MTLFMGIADGYPHREAMWTVFLAENMLDDCETGQFYVSHCERYRGSLLCGVSFPSPLHQDFVMD